MTQYRFGKWLGWDVGIVVSVLGLVACGRLLATDAFTALQIVQVQVMTEGDCTVPGAATGVHRTSGVLDLALPQPPNQTVGMRYLLPILVANNLASLGGGPAEEENNITLSHFTVQLSAANVQWSDACPTTFDTPTFSYTLTPGGATGAAVDLITPAHARCILPYVTDAHLLVTAKVWAKGRHGGTTIESAPLIYPIDVCKGCLQQDYTEPSLAVYRYPAGYPYCDSLSGVNPYTGDACLPPGQDATILCCGVTTASGGATPLCPGTFTGTTTTATASNVSTTP
jgi:hypothetical protein